MNRSLLFYLSLIIVLVLTGLTVFGQNEDKKTYVKAPFKKVDRLATNDWWNRGDNDLIDLRVDRKDVVAFGLYTVSSQTVKISAQLFPLFPEETRVVRLEIEKNNRWNEIQSQSVNELGWSALFRIENWTATEDIPYRIRHGDSAVFEGLIRKDPADKNEIVMAALSCNSKKDRGDRENYVRNINHQDPDLIFFAGDQSYDHREHTAAWLLFGMQFRETFRNRPCITIPDDHDIGMYNLWGESGKKGKGTFSFSGGYRFHHEYVKMVERCQTAHLPDPYDPTPVKQGIGVYYTNYILGGIDFAIIEDRKFKSGPKGKVPPRGIRPDLIKSSKYDVSKVDVEGLVLLGERQLQFLDKWAKQQDSSSIKVVLSQTAFFSGPHRHGKNLNRAKADLDSNGWPQTGRNKAVSAIKKANAIHIAGDQHIALVVQHGIENYQDGPWEFTVPAIVNTIYERWWWPDSEKPGENTNDVLPWTGNYLDGFDNKITMQAYANPDGPSTGAGYGLIRFNKASREVTFECWPRFVDVTTEGARQFVGWPITIELD
ncbi:MAG: hypothetical protein ACI9YU_002114 [Flavobacteriales bacterium]|jgi:hypothetical protein